jgi:O-antigen/teichoic acid export membrane protein
VFALPVVVLVYGGKWTPAADILVPLAALGSLRVVCDLIAGYLYARGRSRAVLWTQVAWFVVLIPALVLGARLDGGFGVGVTHAIVALVVVVPAYLVMLLRSHDDVPTILAALWPPLVAGVVAALAGLWLDERLGGGVAGGMTAGLVAGALYLGTTLRWFLPRLRQLVGRMSTANGLETEQPLSTGALV